MDISNGSFTSSVDDFFTFSYQSASDSFSFPHLYLNSNIVGTAPAVSPWSAASLQSIQQQMNRNNGSVRDFINDKTFGGGHNTRFEKGAHLAQQDSSPHSDR